MTAQSHLFCRLSKSDNHVHHNVRKEVKKEKKEKKEQSQRHKEIKKQEYISGDFNTIICLPKKKKGSCKQKHISLHGNGIIIKDSKQDSYFPLKSLCMVQQEETLIKRSPRTTFTSPFTSRKDKSNGDKTLLICTQNLTRIWIKFNDKITFIKWILSIDGLLGIFYNSSLLVPLNKSLYLRECYLNTFEGGVIKVGDDDEWNYIGSKGLLSCCLSKDNQFHKCKFTFDGQFLCPEFDFEYTQCGEWDGMNVFWYENLISGVTSERKRKQSASCCFNWNENVKEFEKVNSSTFEDDNVNTWKLTRNFLARKDGMGGGWFQIEGDIPICIAMFLNLFYDSMKDKDSLE